MRIIKITFLLLILILSACREVILHDLSESEANKMLTRLLEERLDVHKDRQTDGKWSLSLPSEQSSAAIRFLSDRRLLKQETSTVPEKSGLMASREEQRFRYERALSKEIEGTLAGIAGVLQARVHLNLPIMDPVFGQSIDNSKSSASVLLVLGNESVDKTEVSSLVAGASGIPIASISVMVSKGFAEEVSVTKQDPTVLNPDNKNPENAKNVSVANTVTNQAAIKKTSSSLIAEWKSLLYSMPWSWVAFAVGFSLIMVGVVRLLNRREKVVL